MIDPSASSRIVGAFVFPEFWENSSACRSNLAALRDVGVNAIMTESDRYDFSAIEATHNSGLRFYAGVACFSDHAANFRFIKERPELWPILENGERRPQMEWYVGMTPIDSRRQEEVLATIGSIARTYPVDGLFLDFVRWPLHWEIELRPGQPKPLDFSFHPTTLAKFEAAFGALPGGLNSIPAKAAWIRENRFAGLDRLQMPSHHRLRCEGAKRSQGCEARCRAWRLPCAEHKWAYGAANRPANPRSCAAC